MAVERLKINYKAQEKKGPIQKLKTIQRTMNSHWPDHRHNTQS